MQTSEADIPPVIHYASPPMAKPRITFRGAVVTLIVGGSFLLLGIILILLAWAIFEKNGEFGSRVRNLEGLATMVCVVAGIMFLTGIIVSIMGLKGVRQREID